MHARRILAAAAVAAMAVTLPGAVARGATDRPNTFLEARDSASLAHGAWVKERLSSAGDQDWFRYAVPAAAKVNVVVGGLPENYTLEVYDTIGTKIATSTHGGTQFERVLVNARAGSLYARVVSGAGRYDPNRDYLVQFRTLPKALVVNSAFATRRADGRLDVVADIYNNAGVFVRMPTVRVEFLDAAKRVVGRDLLALTIMDIPPNGSSKVVSPTIVRTPAGYAGIRVTPEWSPGPVFTPAKLTVSGLRTSVAANGVPTYTGTVTTSSTTVVDNAVLDVSQYDAFGRLRAQSYWMVDPVVAGSPKPFRATLYQATAKPNRVAVSVVQQFFEP
jgi:hypothetical protein